MVSKNESTGFRIVHSRVNLFRITQEGSGRVPAVLGGEYNSKASAENAIRIYGLSKEKKAK